MFFEFNTFTAMIRIEDYNFNNKRALVRVDFNVPLNKEGQVTDTNRIDAALPTINKILKDGGSVILMSHMGRPKGEVNPKYSLSQIVSVLEEKLNRSVDFVSDCISSEAKQKASNLKSGEILLLENLRFYAGETKGDEAIAQKLSELGDVWVMDAFGTAHRAHASTAVVGRFFKEKVAGYVILKEIDNANKILSNGEKPLTVITGGAKISDKILILENLLDTVDNILVGGGMTYTFVKALGGKIGNSLVENDRLDMAKDLIQKAKDKNVNLVLPVDDIIADAFSNDANIKTVASGEIPDGFMGLDIGDKTIQKYSEIIKNSKTILWNGPMGVFEMSNFAKGTVSVAEAVVEATKNGAFSLIGGGDSAAAVNNLGFGDDVSYVSTGGGALLEYMEGKTLPGIEALG